jgi:hypothetical protein
MTLKLVTPDAVVGDVSFTVPGSDQLGSLKITFTYQTARQHDAWRDQAIAEASSGKRTMTQILAPVVKAWDGLLDDQGKPVSFSTEALDDLIDRFPAAATELFRGYTRVLTESRVKN